MPRTPLQALAFLLGVTIALFLSPFSGRADDGFDAKLAEHESALYTEVNRVRARHQLIPLTRRPDFDRVARAHSADMAQRGYFAHDSPEGTNPVDRLELAGLSGFTLAAENLGRTDRHFPLREIVEGWLRSPDHRRNLLAPPFNTTGVGVARAAGGALVYTQLYVTVPRH